MDVRMFKGLKNTTSEDRFTDGDLSVADNVDLDNTGKPLVRLRTTTLDGGSYHSLWADGDVCLVVESPSLGQDPVVVPWHNVGTVVYLPVADAPEIAAKKTPVAKAKSAEQSA